MNDIKYGKIVDFVHMLIKNSYEDDKNLKCIDATVGNGFDTLFLCNLCQNNGFVYGFDVQDNAIKNTEKLLNDNNCDNYKLILDSHENLLQYINTKIDICVFNLGYLPNSDKTVKTNYQSSIRAIENAIMRMSDIGRIYISSYILHDEGEESNHILEYISNLDRRKYNVIKIKLLNKNNFPPEIYIIESNK
ncbi:class I SAM-dependent methyltransferase [Sedimentibacter sp. zth1]|uniref:tRNA (mnm(5)s(2)U34)-methyltransferase n=1 Tax=Sedimentibacter sp. zth1 TaxID=2816908 RepID=UPI001A92F02F|nr:class I SAM-dependent methyltransferase [Sedimentibacter sp. zth1]QSX06794.1 class I SAM-dependent methyltransferase [Sedimentibacter sp. zth1]